jgi:hypothetical protein
LTQPRLPGNVITMPLLLVLPPFLATLVQLGCFIVSGEVVYLVLAVLFGIASVLLLRAAYRSLG